MPPTSVTQVQLWPRFVCGLSFSRSQPDSESFSPGTPVFLPPQNRLAVNYIRLGLRCSEITHGSYDGSRGRLHMHSVQSRWAGWSWKALVGRGQLSAHSHNLPWITPEFKTLIAKRQQAFISGDMDSYRHLRNALSQSGAESSFREKYFASKVQHLKNTKPSKWWGKVKRIAGMSLVSGSDCLCSALHVEGLDHPLQDRNVANAINSAFLDPTMTFSPLAVIPPFEPSSAVLTLSEVNVLSALSKLNPRKAAGPDGIRSTELGA